MLARWKRISSQDKFKNPWWTYRVDRFEMPGGTQGEYHSVHTGGSVIVVPVGDDGRILMTRQYRYLGDRESLEFPAGGMKDGEDPETIAHKELVEEAGFDGDLEYLGNFFPYNGVADETCHAFLARSLTPSDAHEKDETEDFELVWCTPAQVDAAMAGEVKDGQTLAAWTLAKPKIRR